MIEVVHQKFRLFVTHETVLRGEVFLMCGALNEAEHGIHGGVVEPDVFGEIHRAGMVRAGAEAAAHRQHQRSRQQKQHQTSAPSWRGFIAGSQAPHAPGQKKHCRCGSRHLPKGCRCKSLGWRGLQIEHGSVVERKTPRPVESQIGDGGQSVDSAEDGKVSAP